MSITKRLVVLGGACSLVIGSVLYLLFNSHDSEVLVASTASLTSEWAEFRPESTMKTSGDRSELWIELLNVHEDQDGTYIWADGSRLSLEGYLVSDSGQELSLRSSQGGIGLTKLLYLSSPALEWKQRKYKFRGLFLRADLPLKVGRIVWISYDPQATKSGVKIPDAFLKD